MNNATESLESILQLARKREKDFKSERDITNETYKARLFKLILRLTVASFIFLVVIVVFQMYWKVRHPEYQIISDSVINILAVGVFAELVGVVGIIAKLLWKQE